MKHFKDMPKRLKITAFILLAVILAGAVLCVAIFSKDVEKSPQDNTDIIITEEDLQQYRKNIGDSMDVKKSILIIFNTQEECQSFIESHGDDTDPLAAGEGITPLMEDGYFNCVGNVVFEPLFDTMLDGAHLKEPVLYGGAYCYFKRLQNYSVVNSDEDLKEFIRKEKTMEKGGELNEKAN